MMKILMTMMMMMMLSMIIMMMCTTISKNMKMDREKISPFECGFDPQSKTRMPFSLQFFLIAILFLIFDVEIMIILPMINTMKISNMLSWSLTTTMFITILTSGLYYEWKNGMLEWT